MNQSAGAMIAACGLDCTGCNLFLAKTDEKSAASLVEWFKQEGWLKAHEGAKEIMDRGPYCLGCHGDQSIQWSGGECWIRKCCVVDKGLKFCSECQQFPCAKLSDWSRQNARYTAAMDRLRLMRDSTSGR